MVRPKLNFSEDFHRHTDYKTFSEKVKLNILVDFIRKNNINKVLDVGCHTGNVSLPLAYLGIDVKAIDINKDILVKAADRDKQRTVKWSNEDFKQLDGKYDAILFLDLLEYTEDPHEYINKAFKLLNDGGYVLLSIPNGYNPFELLWDIPMQKIRKILHKEMRPGDIHIQFFTINRILNLINKKFEIYSAESFMFLNFLPLLHKSHFISLVDYILAERLPLAVTSRWMIIIIRKL